MTALIVANGSIKDYSFYKKYFDNADLIICADGGATHMKMFNVSPDILLGDFDSVSKDDYEYFASLGTEIIKFPIEKDYTDTEIAVDYAIEKGYKSIILIGCLGSRYDHSMSNIFLLKSMMDRGVTGVIVNENNEITLTDRWISLAKENGVKVSLLPLTDKVYGVTTNGLYYPLCNATLEIGSSLGVSNEFTQDIAEVSLSKGILIVLKSRD